MKKRSTPPMITIRQRLENRGHVNGWFETTKELFNRAAGFYFEVLRAHPGVIELANEEEALTALEKLTHRTKRNPDPVMLLDGIGRDIPAMFRRAAIHAALGSYRSWWSNYQRWLKVKGKYEAKKPGKRYPRRPPVPPRAWNKSVVFYKGMWKERVGGRIVLKLYDGQTWRWVRFRLSGREVPEGWEAGSPQVVKKGRAWWLHTPVKKDFPKVRKLKDSLREPGARVCSVDMNLNDAVAVCVVQDANGAVVATKFIRGNKELQGRRKRQLGRIARNRSLTGICEKAVQDNKHLWGKVNSMDENAAHRVSRRIVDFAAEHGCTAIAFEHLDNLRPTKEKYSRRANQRRAYWLKGRLFRCTRYKAWNEGIITSRVNPKGTSRECACCHSQVARYHANADLDGYTPGAPLIYCPNCGRKDHADRNAARIIGQRLFARTLAATPSTYLEKPPC